MLDVMQFIFRCISQFITMLFSINIGSGLNLGLFMCIIFVFLPLVLFVINLVKHIAISDVISDYKYEKNNNKKRGGR